MSSQTIATLPDQEQVEAFVERLLADGTASITIVMAALLAAGYQVYAINPLQVARYRERYRVSGAKSEAV